ncbi:MAG: DUF4406 domain-containing protein [Christensenella sp.]|nr:DUF4406 domain-containing protein [Christensenella sp.]
MPRDIRCLCACCRADYERAGYEIIPVIPVKREPCDKCDRPGMNVEIRQTVRPKVVFVCSPFGGLVENQELAAKYCAREVAAGNVPFAPHLFYTWFMSEATERDKAIRRGIEMLYRCDEVHVYEEPTQGMKREIAAAIAKGIKVVYMEA